MGLLGSLHASCRGFKFNTEDDGKDRPRHQACASIVMASASGHGARGVPMLVLQDHALAMQDCISRSARSPSAACALRSVWTILSPFSIASPGCARRQIAVCLLGCRRWMWKKLLAALSVKFGIYRVLVRGSRCATLLNGLGLFGRKDSKSRPKRVKVPLLKGDGLHPHLLWHCRAGCPSSAPWHLCLPPTHPSRVQSALFFVPLGHCTPCRAADQSGTSRNGGSSGHSGAGWGQGDAEL